MLNTFIGHIYYIVFLFFITGIGILFIDAKGYEKRQMPKEHKASRFLGWSNVALGVIVFVAYWFLGGY